MIYTFGGFELDPDRFELRFQASPVHIEPQVFELLHYLIQHRERVVTKIELLDSIWGGAFVSESALTSRIKSARRAVDDTGRSQRVIRTVHRRGYQFVADVDVDVGQTAPNAAGGDAPRSAERPPTSSPSGTVTFVFSDIERSSMLWERHPQVMPAVLDRHDRLLHDAVESRDGFVFASAGDGIAAAFWRAGDALAAALEIQAALDREPWPDVLELKVRLGLHTGEAVERDGDYVGTSVNRAARVMQAAHGGQTVLSDVTAGILGDREGLVDLGICVIDPAMPPMRLWQVGAQVYPPLTGTIAAAPPVLRTELIGRDADLERVAELCAENRLVSITGTGGSGKTTLALAAANSLLASYPAGVAFAELASAGDGGAAVATVGEAAGVLGDAAIDATALVAHLADRPMLLVLDNCEHVIDDVAELVDRLLDAGDGISVLTTTREPLDIDGETVFTLAPLAEHAPTLFALRAREVSPDVAVSADDPLVRSICAQLDGLPLAIELAAAQLRGLGLDDLAQRLDARLDLARSGRTRARARHVSLESTIAWSYDLLEPDAQWLLRQLGVFPASFDLASAEAVGAGPDRRSIATGVAALVTKQLVVRHPDSGRFRLLETIRAFARRRLEEAGEADDAAERLRCHVVTRASSRPRHQRWLSGSNAVAFRLDLDNARFAFERSLALGTATDALELVIDGSFLWRNTLHCSDGRRWIAALSDDAATLPDADARWLDIARADLGQGTAEHEAIAAAVEHARSLHDDPSGDADPPAHVVIGHFEALAYIVAEPPIAAEKLAAVRTVAESCRSSQLVDLVDAFTAVTVLADGDVARSVALAEEVAGRVDGDGYEVFIANWAAWIACLIAEDGPRLRRWTDRQRQYLLRVGLRETWLTIWSMALSSAVEGEDVLERLRIARRRADREGLESAADAVLALSVIERLAGRPDRAAELLGAVTGHRLNNTAHYVLYRSLRRALRDQLGAERLDAAMHAGSGRPLDDILDAGGLSL